MSNFTIKAGDFEGPLDVLLDLIEKRKFHISDVSLSQVTDDFVSYVRDLPEVHMGNLAQFILVASTLLLIKSKSLLPTLTLSQEEQSDIADLEYRLEALKRVREVSQHIKERFGQDIIFARNSSTPVTPIFSPEESVTKSNIISALHDVIANIPIKEFIPRAVVKKVISLEEMIDRLLVRVQSQLKTSFRQFSGESTEKVTIIVSFLAMLELVKQGSIAVKQDEHFSDIEMETINVGVPRII